MANVALNDDQRRALDRLRDDLQRVFGDRLRSIVAYGPALERPAPGQLHSLAVVDRLSFADLQACATRAADWQAQRLAIPLLLGADEFQRTLDAFPLEYGGILARHVIHHGDDPLVGLSIDHADVRRACELQAKSHLIHLREGFIEARGRPAEVAALVRASAPAFVALLAHVARLLPSGSSATDIESAAAAVGLDAALVQRASALSDGAKLDGPSAITLYPDYLAAAERLWRYLDTWSA
jgi:hypothetical protein